MQVLYAVIDDVYDGTVGFTIKLIRTYLNLGNEARVMHPDNLIVGEHVEAVTPEEPVGEFRSLSAIIEEKSLATVGRSTVAYALSASLPVFRSPTKEFDTIVKTVPYGALLLLLGEEGRFAQVSVDGTVGWVERDEIGERAGDVYPSFVVGHAYGYSDTETRKLRSAIGDAFGGGEIEVPLQAGEYVTYRLLRRGAKILWGNERPRTPGRWHVLLKGREGIHISITPTKGSIMEMVLDGDIGHLAYVEAVYPDESVTITEANFPDSGVFSERTLTKEEWQAVRSVFIEVA